MQTNYSPFPGQARPGSLYDGGPKDVVSRTSSQLIPFGSFVVKDIGDGNVLLPSAGPSASSVIEGVAMSTQFVQSGLTGDGVIPGYPAGRPINVMRKGRIWVYCTTAFNPDTDSLYVRITQNGANALVYPSPQAPQGSPLFPAGNYGLVPGTVGNVSDSGKCVLLGASGFLVGYEPLNTLTAAGFLALDLTIPSTVR